MSKSTRRTRLMFNRTFYTAGIYLKRSLMNNMGVPNGPHNPFEFYLKRFKNKYN